MRRYKILYIINNLTPGGAEHLCVDHLNRLDHEIFNPTLLLLNNQTQLLNRLRGDMEVIIEDFTKLNQIISLWRIFKRIEQIKPEIIHSQLILADWISGFYKIAHGDCPVVTTIHGYNTKRLHDITLKHKFHFYMQSKFYRRFDKVVCVSKDLSESVQKEFSVPEEKIEVIYNGIKKIGTLPIYENHRGFSGRLIFIGRLVPVKNIPLLFQALLKLPETYSLTIVGAGEQEFELERQIKELHLSERIHMTGYIEPIDRILMNHDILIVPSFHETFSITALQGLAIGIPTICSNRGGIKELVSGNLEELLFDPFSVDDLVSCIVRIVENYPFVLKRLIKHQDHFRRFSFEHCYQKYQELYLNLLNNRRLARSTQEIS